MKAGDTTLLNSNISIGNGNTYCFSSGPISVSSGQRHTFEVINRGAAIQPYVDMRECTISAVPKSFDLFFAIRVGSDNDCPPSA